MVVTATTAYGAPAAAYPMHNVGVVAADRLDGAIGNRMKAAFAQFLSLRHGGSGYVFGYGSGLPGQNTDGSDGQSQRPDHPGAAMASPIPADRPFHSLSYPDINYTIMRPAALPPSPYTDPQPTATPTIPWPPSYDTRGTTARATPGCGTRRSTRVHHQPVGVSTGKHAESTPADLGARRPAVLLPPAIPPRRLFQPPDAFWSSVTNPAPPPKHNYGEQRQRHRRSLPEQPRAGNRDGVDRCPPGHCELPVADQQCREPGLAGGTTLPPTALPSTSRTRTSASELEHGYAPADLSTEAAPLLPHRDVAEGDEPDHGADAPVRGLDHGRLLRGHAAGRPADGAAARNPVTLAFDILGPEIGASTGQTTRYRGFFLVDRTKLYGFDDTTPRQLPPGRRLSPDDRIMTLIVVSSQCPEMREREVASGQCPEMRATWRNATSN